MLKTLLRSLCLLVHYDGIVCMKEADLPANTHQLLATAGETETEIEQKRRGFIFKVNVV